MILHQTRQSLHHLLVKNSLICVFYGFCNGSKHTIFILRDGNLLNSKARENIFLWKIEIIFNALHLFCFLWVIS